MKLTTRLTGILLAFGALGFGSAIAAQEAQTGIAENREQTISDQTENDTKSAVNSEQEISGAIPKVNVKIQGIHQEKLNNNVQIYLQTIDKDEFDGSEHHQHLLTENIDKALRPFGYYNSRVFYQLQPTHPKPTLVATVDVGEPVKLEGTDIKLTGAATTDPEFQKLDKKVPPKGAILEHEAYDNYKNSLEKLAQQRGYFDADFPVHQLQVMPSTNQGWWYMVFNSGERYRYGNISFKHAQIREDYLRNILKIKSGDEYLINDISTMTSDYSSSGWFQSVMVKPTLHEKSKLVDLDVLMYPKKKHSMELGVGYSTDLGPHAKIGWTRPWINSRGHSVHSNLYISSPKQTFEASYKMPLLENPLNYYYEYAVGFEKENNTDIDTESTAATAAALRYWNNPTGWQYSVGVRARYDKFTQANTSEKTWLLYPTTTISRSRLSGGSFPDRADTLSLTVDLGNKIWTSDVNFYRVRATAGWIKRFAHNHRFLTRAELGYLHTSEFNRIPPALRFFAGGDRSVRGYGYKKISPKDKNGKLLGASRLATATLEYQYQVVDGWWWASFFDAGLAADQYKTDELRYGAGMGVRWASPVGAIKFDIATPVRDKDDSKNIQFYIGLGAEL
ncbi:autotransporter secretion outer membrane protein TamA [Pasteurella langaaensis DSM 22999]|uniref:Translocation and assembly module subunit TamA n=1 Tax=Alitibacter langaaensis DSM 22999 TaxID=1122935 RepID=A0A2U0SM31_9PAST|nr:autotransporter assembly complex family protein [Pasteurella langaaensis]PVX32414.1 autotransporter secretion outer membrane protein TamA [Pasteurella langaaensis DSM 22999]